MNTRGFTLVEMVVAIAISALVMVFAAMFIAAPIGAYESASQRQELVADATAAWPRLQADLRQSLPQSLRVRRNGNYEVIEMLAVVGHARYLATPTDNFAVAGSTQGIFGTLQAPLTLNGVYLSVNNRGVPGANAYAQSGSMTGRINLILGATGTPGRALLDLSVPAAFTADSPQHKIYLVTGPVAYLCDRRLGTLRRYSQYTIAANQAARDTPAEFSGAAASLVAQGLTGCDFQVSAPGGTQAQTASLRFTLTRQGETLVLAHAARAEFVP